MNFYHYQKEIVFLSDSGQNPIEWTKSSEGVKLPHQKRDCIDCKNELICCECVIKRKMNCFNCEVVRACISSLDLVNEKKTYSTDVNMIKKKAVNKNHQMLPYYISEYELKLKNIGFEFVRELLMKEEDKMVVKRRFERLENLMEVKF